ncbi:Uncharacterized protein FWK35_00027541 [Aphis craccivora]|uniref:Uncharacterized protein n=1 Tax=Aphis craccivora TaxID=307492 RepID=A0A6G0W3N3_APHCR|nr:Uncharacterized protein FWK35_00027541 [Aphis craccivora]
MNIPHQRTVCSVDVLCIPLKHVCGICEDYKRILLNCSQHLRCIRDMNPETVKAMVKKVKLTRLCECCGKYLLFKSITGRTADEQTLLDDELMTLCTMHYNNTNTRSSTTRFYAQKRISELKLLIEVVHYCKKMIKMEEKCKSKPVNGKRNECLLNV